MIDMVDVDKMVKLVQEIGVGSTDPNGTIYLKDGSRLVPSADVRAGCDTCGWGEEVSVTWEHLAPRRFPASN